MIIGRGELATRLILRKLIPNSNIRIQVPLVKLLSPELLKNHTERQGKETVDIVVYRNEKNPLVVRIQDKRHRSKYMSNIDEQQKLSLELSGCNVADIPEGECPQLFKEKVNDQSINEVLKYISDYV